MQRGLCVLCNTTHNCTAAIALGDASDEQTNVYKAAGHTFNAAAIERITRAMQEHLLIEFHINTWGGTRGRAAVGSGSSSAVGSCG